MIPHRGTRDAVEQPAASLATWFEPVPSNHNGTDAFTFRTYFSAAVALDAADMKDHAFETVGGSVTDAQPVNDSKLQWDITVQPSGDSAVTVRLPAGRDCATPGAACTPDGRRLYNTAELTVPHQPPTDDPPTDDPRTKGVGPPAIDLESPTVDPVPPTVDPTVPVGRLIWQATLTAAPLYTAYGYSDFTGFRYGSLAGASFDIEDVTYTVNVIEAGGWIYIGFDTEMPGSFILEVDGLRLASADATLTTYSYTNMYRWDGTGITWSDGATAQLKLYLPVEDSG